MEAIEGLLADHPEVQVVVLTASGGDNVLVSAIEKGAAGFVSKTSGVADVTSAVRAAAAGEAVISPEMLARLLPRLRRGQSQGRHSLTTREREVLDLVAEGLTNAAIADRLVVSVHTVRNHIANLSTKLDAHRSSRRSRSPCARGCCPSRSASAPGRTALVHQGCARSVGQTHYDRRGSALSVSRAW